MVYNVTMVEKKKHNLILSAVAMVSVVIGGVTGYQIGNKDCISGGSHIPGGSITVSAEGADRGEIVLAKNSGNVADSWVEGQENYTEKVKGEEITDQENKCDLRVDVSGAVVTPGVYCLEKGDRVVDALASAGGVNEQVYAFKYFAQRFNQSEPVADGQKIYIPFYDDQKCVLDTSESEKYASITSDQNAQTVKGSDKTGEGTCTSLNNASQEELELLSGIGESTAQKIIEGRPYSKIEDLMEVKGIGESIFGKIKNEICL